SNGTAARAGPAPITALSVVANRSRNTGRGWISTMLARAARLMPAGTTKERAQVPLTPLRPVLIVGDDRSRRPDALARLSPAGCVMCSRNSNGYVHSGGRTGVPCVRPGAAGTRRRPGRPTAPHLGSHLAQLGSMDAAHTAQRRGTFFLEEVTGWRRTGGRWERTRGHFARPHSASSSPRVGRRSAPSW